MVQAPSLFEKIRNGSTESREQKEEIVLATFEDHINVLRQPRIEDEPSLSLSLDGCYSLVSSDDAKSPD